MTRTFSEVALCHLPDDEIRILLTSIERGMTSAYSNDAGFFIWRKTPAPYCPVLRSILNRAITDYALFDVDVEPDPELEIYE